MKKISHKAMEAYINKVSECCKCGWVGNSKEKVLRQDSDNCYTHVCPKCGCEDFIYDDIESGDYYE